jgi:DNA-dependent RNA polymerase auxiliary subunit epsilon
MRFNFACDATATTQGRAYFSVSASSEAEARQKLAEDASEYFTEFNESMGDTEWEATEPEDWELI